MCSMGGNGICKDKNKWGKLNVEAGLEAIQ